MKLLIVSTFPPMACGIGRYASQQAAALRAEGHHVDVLSPPAGDGDWQANLFGGLRPLRLLKYMWAYDDCYIHFTPFFYFNNGGSAFDRALTSFAFVIVMALCGRRASLIVHETAFSVGETRRRGLRRYLDRWSWRFARRTIFHTARERDSLIAFYGLNPAKNTFEIWPHEKYFDKLCTQTREEVRRDLSVPADACLFLCIGFIQQHKGFDRALSAFAQAPGERVIMKVVGSVRLDWDKAHRYAIELHEKTREDPRAEIVESFVSDELFDQWLVAADYVVLPYKEINTSGVAARAKLYNRPVIVADAGALAEQTDVPGSRVFRDDDELARIIREIAGNGQAVSQ